VDTLLQEGALNTDQQVVGQHTEEDVGFNPPLQMMEDRSFAQGAFHGAEGSLNPRQQKISAPDLFGAQVLAAAFEQVTATEVVSR
jgi:hypothetical protein